MIWSKRPGTGIPSYKMEEIIGKRAKKILLEILCLNGKNWSDDRGI